MLPTYLTQTVIKHIREVEAPTPIANGELLPITDFGMNRYDLALLIDKFRIASNFLAADYTPFSGQYNAGATNILSWAMENQFNLKLFNEKMEYTSFQVEAGNHAGIAVIEEHAISTRIGWDEFIENTAVFGIPGEGIPGLLTNSAIPQVLDSLNYFNGTLTGEQMVDGLLRWTSYVYENTNYRFRSKVMGIPPRLAKVLNNTKFQAAQNETALIILKDRLSTATAGNLDIVEVPMLEYAKMMTFLPDDPEMVALGVVDLAMRDEFNEIEYQGGTLGTVAIRPEAALNVRLSGL